LISGIAKNERRSRRSKALACLCQRKVDRGWPCAIVFAEDNMMNPGQDSERKDKARRAFNRLIGVTLRKLEDSKRTIRDGTIMGCSRMVPKYGPDSMRGISEGLESAKAIFAERFTLPAEGEARVVWKEALLATLIEGLESAKYYGDPEDPEPYAHNDALGEIIRAVPAFLEGLEI
jgi:hypothetical protein